MKLMAFFGVFSYVLLPGPPIDTLIFLEMKGAKVAHKSCKFHLYLTCNS